jgi:hypothetical protein
MVRSLSEVKGAPANADRITLFGSYVCPLGACHVAAASGGLAPRDDGIDQRAEWLALAARELRSSLATLCSLTGMMVGASPTAGPPLAPPLLETAATMLAHVPPLDALESNDDNRHAADARRARLRSQVAVIRTLADRAEHVVRPRESDGLSDQLIEEMARLGCQLLEAAAWLTESPRLQTAGSSRDAPRPAQGSEHAEDQ